MNRSDIPRLTLATLCVSFLGSGCVYHAPHSFPTTPYHGYHATQWTPLPEPTPHCTSVIIQASDEMPLESEPPVHKEVGFVTPWVKDDVNQGTSPVLHAIHEEDSPVNTTAPPEIPQLQPRLAIDEIPRLK